MEVTVLLEVVLAFWGGFISLGRGCWFVFVWGFVFENY